MPSQDRAEYYSSPDSEEDESTTPASARITNRGNKLHKLARTARHGRIAGWSAIAPTTHDERARKRPRLNLTPNIALLPASSTGPDDPNDRPAQAVLPPPPKNPIDILTSPALVRTFAAKESHLPTLALSAIGLIEADTPCLKALTKVCTILRGDDLNWRGPSAFEAGWGLSSVERRQRLKTQQQQPTAPEPLQAPSVLPSAAPSAAPSPAAQPNEDASTMQIDRAGDIQIAAAPKDHDPDDIPIHAAGAKASAPEATAKANAADGAVDDINAADVSMDDAISQLLPQGEEATTNVQVTLVDPSRLGPSDLTQPAVTSAPQAETSTEVVSTSPKVLQVSRNLKPPAFQVIAPTPTTGAGSTPAAATADNEPDVIIIPPPAPEVGPIPTLPNQQAAVPSTSDIITPETVRTAPPRARTPTPPPSAGAQRLAAPQHFVESLFVTPTSVILPTSGYMQQQQQLNHTILSPVEQQALLHASLMELHRFLADSLEYQDRLGEIRDQVLAVERRRKGVNAIIRSFVSFSVQVSV